MRPKKSKSLIGVTSGGDWTNSQFTGSPVDPTGLTFTAHYGDGRPDASVNYETYSPENWGDTAGTQTCTFTFVDAVSGETATCAVEATVEEGTVTVTSLTITGTLTASNDTISGLSNDGLTFTYGLSNGESVSVACPDEGPGFEIFDEEYNVYKIATPSGAFDFEYGGGYPCWVGSGTQTVTYTVSDEDNYWADHDIAIASPAPTASYEYTVEETPTLESLSVSGSLTNPQYVGSSPDLTGLTFVSTFSDGHTASTTNPLSLDSISPETYSADGNPANLRTADLIFATSAPAISDGHIVDTSVYSGLNDVVTHRPTDQTLSASTGGYVYYDLTQSMMNDWVCGPMQILTGEANPTIGDYINLVFTQDEMDDPTELVTLAKMGGWAQDLKIQGDQSQGINPGDPNFVPGFGVFKNNSLSDSYVGVSLQGGATIAEPMTIYTVFGTLKSAAIDPSVGYCLADLETSGRTTYITRVTV